MGPSGIVPSPSLFPSAGSLRSYDIRTHERAVKRMVQIRSSQDSVVGASPEWGEGREAPLDEVAAHCDSPGWSEDWPLMYMHD